MLIRRVTLAARLPIAGFQPDEEEAEQDARPPSHASSVTSECKSLPFCACDVIVHAEM
jgi:hypothetical protein